MTDAPLGLALRLIEDAWEEVRRGPFVRQALGIAHDRLVDISPGEAERKATVGRNLQTRARAIALDQLPHDVALSVRVVRFRAETWAREADWYWTVVDPMGVGFFGLFLPTAYCGGFLLSAIRPALAGFQFKEAGDLDRYLALAADYARLIDQMRDRTVGQADRGILMPKPQIEQARVLLQASKAQARALFTVTAERLVTAGPSAAGFTAELERRLVDRIEPAFDRLLGVFSDDYVRRAPDQVGIGQYPGGREIYEELVKLHTTVDLTPEQVHRIGLDRMAEIEDRMRAIRAEVGFDGDSKAFLSRMEQDPRWRADTPAGVAAAFQRYIDRMAERFGDYFSAGAQAGHGVEPLPAALEASMTFGYYDGPRPDRPRGLYLFNAANMTRRPLFDVAALCFHELVPGHHLHFASQQENPGLHPLRTHSFVNAFNEGWAEYSGVLAGEMGMYREPEERYGRLTVDAFLTSRLVVDTGMNVMGWSLEQAREYLRAKTAMSEPEIRSETVRYSCDIPGQSLAYKMGDTKMLELRQRMRNALGPRFDIKAFHAAVLAPGALPLPDLDWHLARETERLLSA